MDENTKFNIVVDYDQCEGNGRCEAEAPAIFEVDDDDRVVVHEDQAVASNLEVARRAVTRCPKSALKIVEG